MPKPLNEPFKSKETLTTFICFSPHLDLFPEILKPNYTGLFIWTFPRIFNKHIIVINSHFILFQGPMTCKITFNSRSFKTWLAKFLLAFDRSRRESFPHAFYCFLFTLSYKVTVYRLVGLRKTTGCPVIGGAKVTRNFTATEKRRKIYDCSWFTGKLSKICTNCFSGCWNWLLFLPFHSFTLLLNRKLRIQSTNFFPFPCLMRICE